MSRYILLSFDVEEFDLPLEYGCAIGAEEQMAIGKKGLDAIMPLLSDAAISTTLFTTANFAMQYPESIRALAPRHEIASHSFYHSRFEEAHLQQSKQKLEEIAGTRVTGLRMPRMKQVPMEAIRVAGYDYDSSINPTWIPRRYNNLRLPRTIYREKGMTRVPAAVSPHLRIPLFWLSFKNLPYPLFKQLALQTLRRDGYLCLYFHPWEFTGIGNYGLPGYTCKPDGELLLDRLMQLVKRLKQEGEFISIQRFLEQKSPR